MPIALYKGQSALSRLIKAVNWSEYSHAARVNPVNGQVAESWGKTGVRRVGSLSEQHEDGTLVDIFDVKGETETAARVIDMFIEQQLGKGYDWLSVLHFVTHRPEYTRCQDRWFCSELIAAAYSFALLELLARIPAWKVYPGMLAYSPVLVYRCTVETVKKSEIATTESGWSDLVGVRLVLKRAERGEEP